METVVLFFVSNWHASNGVPVTVLFFLNSLLIQDDAHDYDPK